VSAMSEQTQRPNPPRVVAVFTGDPGYATQPMPETKIVAIRVAAQRDAPELVAA
jgi:hypothetical protein